MSYRVYMAISLLLIFSSTPLWCENAVDYGMGVNSATGALLNTCVSFVRPADVDSAARFTGRSFQYQYRAIENAEELRESLEVSASSSIRGLWGSASASANYFKSVQVNQYDLTMLITARILSDSVPVQATTNAEALKTGNKKLTPGQMFIKCGDEYVSAIQYGGAIYAFLVVNTRSRVERERLQAELSGSFKSGIEVNAQAQRNVEHILRNNSYYITFFQEGGDESAGVPDKTGIASFFDWAHRAEKNILAHPTIMQIETKPLSSVYPDIKFTTAANQRNVLRRLEALIVSAEDRRKNLSFTARHQYRFPGVDSDAVKSSLDAVTSFLKEVQYLAGDCYREVSLCSDQALKTLTTDWKNINLPLPKEEPLYGVFDFATFEAVSRGFARRTGCPEKWYWTLRLGDVEITTNNSKLNYYFTCDRTNYCYDCGGGWDCVSPDPRPTWSGKVTADLKIVGDTVLVTNIDSPGKSYDGACEAPLSEFIRLRNGAKIK